MTDLYFITLHLPPSRYFGGWTTCEGSVPTTFLGAVTAIREALDQFPEATDICVAHRPANDTPRDVTDVLCRAVAEDIADADTVCLPDCIAQHAPDVLAQVQDEIADQRRHERIESDPALFL